MRSVGLGVAVLMIGVLFGCSSDDNGGDSSSAAPPPTSSAAPPAAPVPPGAAPITLSSSTPAATFAALAPTVTVGGVAISSPPCVSFAMADANNNGIIGFGSKSQSATAAVASYPNLAFSLAKLVPGTNGSPSKWVSYIVTGTPTKDATGAVVQGPPGRPSTDNQGTLTDNKNGTYTYCFFRDVKAVKDVVAAATLTAPSVAADLGDLTFDPNAVHRLVIIVSGNAPGTGTNTPNAVQTTVGVPMEHPLNVVYDFIPTATGKAVDPADTSVTQRLVVDRLSCNECHGKLGGIPGSDSATFHGGNRYDPKVCDVCHTDQRKFGQARAVSTNNAFPVDPVTKVPLNTYVADGVTVGDFPVLIHRVHKGELLIKKNYNFAGVLLNETKFPQDIRNCTKCHDTTAPKVAPQGDNWKKVPSRLACGACHDGINFATGKGTRNKLDDDGTIGHIGGAQADDSKCALCHDPVAIPTYHVPVTNPNSANALLVPTSAGGNANTNSAYVASDPNNLPPGAIKVTYDVKSVSRNASKQPVIVFRLLQNGARKDFNAFVAPATSSKEMWDNFFGSPSVYFVWAVPQDGITAPADFNASASGYLRSIWNGTAGTGTGAGTLSAPDADGFYTVTLTGVQVPDSAVMFSGGVGYTYSLTSAPPLTQTNVQGYQNNYYPNGYPVAASTVATTGTLPNKTGGLIVVAPDVQKVATGSGTAGSSTAYTARRPIVEDARCNACHRELGLFTREAFHAGQRNDGTTCSWCHNPARTSSAWSADSNYFIHAIHAADKRTKPFTWHASTTTESFADIGYPGVLSNCETCHLPGTYDFGAAASNAALPNRLYRTVGAGSYPSATASYTPNNKVSSTSATTGTCGASTPPAVATPTTGSALSAFSLSSYVTQSTAAAVVDYGAGFVFNAAPAGGSPSNGCSPTSGGVAVAAPGAYTFFSVAPQATREADPSTLVISPIATACSACHDDTLAIQHMESNGGSFYKPRSTSLVKAEQCTLCHLTGKVADIKELHPALPKPVATP